MKTDTALAIMARSPDGDADTIKTRLAGVLPDPEDRRALYRAFLTDVIARTRAVPGVAVRVAVTPPGRHAGFGRLGIKSHELVPQRGDDLGARERHVFGDLFRSGFTRGVLIGSDLPTLPLPYLVEAVARLGEAGARRRVVLGPSIDGGYYLMGLCGTAAGTTPDLFSRIRWSTAHALDDTVRAATAAGLDVVRLAEWYDVDDQAGLQRLCQDLADPARARQAPATAAVMTRLAGRLVR